MGIKVFVLVMLAGLISGCYGISAGMRYDHMSSIPDTRDLNTVDQIGAYLVIPLSDSKYATEIEIAIAKEIGGAPVVGSDPTGNVTIRQPLYIRRR